MDLAQRSVDAGKPRKTLYGLKLTWVAECDYGVEFLLQIGRQLSVDDTGFVNQDYLAAIIIRIENRVAIPVEAAEPLYKTVDSRCRPASFLA